MPGRDTLPRAESARREGLLLPPTHAHQQVEGSRDEEGRRIGTGHQSTQIARRSSALGGVGFGSSEKLAQARGVGMTHADELNTHAMSPVDAAHYRLHLDGLAFIQPDGEWEGLADRERQVVLDEGAGEAEVLEGDAVMVVFTRQRMLQVDPGAETRFVAGSHLLSGSSLDWGHLRPGPQSSQRGGPTLEWFFVAFNKQVRQDASLQRHQGVNQRE